MKLWIFPILLIMILPGCVLHPRVFVEGSAGRFVRVWVYNTPEKVVEVYKDGKMVYQGTIDEDHFDFFAKVPGTYELRVGNVSLEFEVNPPRWQVLVWMVADNSLSDYVLEDLHEMEVAPDDVSVVVAKDASSDAILALSEDGFVTLKEASINGGSGKQLENFINDYALNTRKILIIWNHGSAWLWDENYSTRAVGIDEDSKDALTAKELASSIPLKFDIIGFDACFMGSVEVVYELRKKADYVVASGDYEPGSGWDYGFLNDLSNDPLEVAMSIVDDYASYYKVCDKCAISLGVFKTSEAENLANSVRDMTLHVNPTEIHTLAASLSTNDDYKKYIKDASEVFSIYEPALESLKKLVIYSKGNSQIVNVFLPNPGLLDDMIGSYEDLSFNEKTGWLDFLREAGL